MGGYEGLEGSGHLAIKALELGLEAALGEESVCALIGS